MAFPRKTAMFDTGRDSRDESLLRNFRRRKKLDEEPTKKLKKKRVSLRELKS